MSEEQNYYEFSNKHKKEVLEFVNYAQLKADLYNLKDYASSVLKESDNDYLNRTVYHEAGHKTLINIVWPNAKCHYGYDKEDSSPMVVIKNMDEIRNAFDDDFYGWYKTHILELLGGYAGEALYNKINLNKLGDIITRLGRLVFYVGSEHEEDSDEYKAFRELLESKFDPFVEEELNLTDILKESCKILAENRDLFGKNLCSARTYFTKKFKQLRKEEIEKIKNAPKGEIK